MTIMWTMSVETAHEFYKRCIDKRADTEEARTEILVELAKEGKMQNIIETNRTKEEIIRDKSSHFSVLHIDATKAIQGDNDVRI